MSRCVVVAERETGQAWAEHLNSRGIPVTCFESADEISSAITEAEIHVLILEIRSADSAEGMLMAQVRAHWPECWVVAVVHDYEFRSSALFSMGLWKPDALLMAPVEPRVLHLNVQSACARRISRELRLMEVPLPRKSRMRAIP